MVPKTIRVDPSCESTRLRPNLRAPRYLRAISRVESPILIPRAELPDAVEAIRRASPRFEKAARIRPPPRTHQVKTPFWPWTGTPAERTSLAGRWPMRRAPIPRELTRSDAGRHDDRVFAASTPDSDASGWVFEGAGAGWLLSPG